MRMTPAFFGPALVVEVFGEEVAAFDGLEVELEGREDGAADDDDIAPMPYNSCMFFASV